MKQQAFYLDWRPVATAPIDIVVSDKKNLKKKEVEEYKPLPKAVRVYMSSFFDSCEYYLRSDGFYIFRLEFDFDARYAPKEAPSIRDLVQWISMVIRAKHTIVSVHQSGIAPFIRETAVRIMLLDSELSKLKESLESLIGPRLTAAHPRFAYNGGPARDLDACLAEIEAKRAGAVLKSDNALAMIAAAEEYPGQTPRLAALRLREQVSMAVDGFYRFREAVLHGQRAVMMPLVALTTLIFGTTAPYLRSCLELVTASIRDMQPTTWLVLVLTSLGLAFISLLGTIRAFEWFSGWCSETLNINILRQRSNMLIRTKMFVFSFTIPMILYLAFVIGSFELYLWKYSNLKPSGSFACIDALQKIHAGVRFDIWVALIFLFGVGLINYVEVSWRIGSIRIVLRESIHFVERANVLGRVLSRMYAKVLHDEWMKVMWEADSFSASVRNLERLYDSLTYDLRLRYIVFLGVYVILMYRIWNLLGG